MRRLDGRVAVVTGAAGGIGLGLAERFALGEGMRVVLSDVREDELGRQVERLRAAGGDVRAVPCDVTDPEQVAAVRDAALEAFGAVHVVCANAGIDGGLPLGTDPVRGPAAWRRIVDVDLWGALHTLRAFLPALRAAEEGHVVVTSSIAALNGYLPGGAAYVAAKMGVLGMTESLCRELRAEGASVAVSCLCPGYVRTGMTDGSTNARPEPLRAAFGRLLEDSDHEPMEPAEVAGIVVDALRDGRFYVLTHPEEALRAVEERRRWMVDGRVPDPPDGVPSAEELYAAAGMRA